MLDLGKLLHQQSYNFVDMFLHRNDLSRKNSIHCVNLAQGIKEPVIYYQQDPDKKYLEAVKKAFADLRHYNGQPQGMYGGMKGCTAMFLHKARALFDSGDDVLLRR